MLVKIVKSQLMFILIGLFVVACGNDDTGKASGSAATAPTPAPAPAKQAEMAAPSGDASSGDFERAPGVVYQDEIYKNWPYQ